MATRCILKNKFDYKNIYELGNILEDYGGVFEEDEYIDVTSTERGFYLQTKTK